MTAGGSTRLACLLTLRFLPYLLHQRDRQGRAKSGSRTLLDTPVQARKRKLREDRSSRLEVQYPERGKRKAPVASPPKIVLTACSQFHLIMRARV
jgi:hypothetical protein